MMRFGSATGSLVNHVQSSFQQPEPVVGMGCTILGWTDRVAGTVIQVGKGWINVQEDRFELVEGNYFSESQHYRFSPNPHGYVQTFRRKKDGSWRIGRDGKGLLLGKREKYRDPHF
jgi:hypothetical protein